MCAYQENAILRSYSHQSSKTAHQERVSESNDGIQPEDDSTRIYVSPIRVPNFIADSRPLPNCEVFLHIIWTRPNYNMPTIPRHIFCHQLMESSDCYFGILTRKRWPPKICDFPVYSDFGEIDVRLETNAQVLVLSEEEIDEISYFHKILFVNIMKAVRKCYAFDKTDGYFVVPLRRIIDAENSQMEIDWNCLSKRFPSKIEKPTQSAIEKEKYIPERWVGKVVTPWYKPDQAYIVCEISNKVFLHSKFIFNKFRTYADYFKQKHNVKSIRSAEVQPMLVARPITPLLDGIKPRPVSSSEKNRRRQKTEQSKDTNTYLAPEFCFKYPFSGIYWYKSIIIPSVLHRINGLLMAEDLRHKIIKEAGIGSWKFPRDHKTNAFYIKNGMNNDEVPTDERHLKFNDETLRFLGKRSEVNNGPTPSQILEALTVNNSQDFLSLERRETLGDSCLKYLVSLFLYIEYNEFDEGQLTNRRSQLVSNENLFYCGEKLDINSYIQASYFSTKLFWRPPSFKIPECFLKMSEMNPPSLLGLDIPENEQLTGTITPETRKQTTNILDLDEKEKKEIDFLLGRQKLMRKNISDVLEALLGTYLLSLGLESAFSLLKYFGILRTNVESLLDLTSQPCTQAEETGFSSPELLPKLKDIERICKYTFKNKDHLLHAFTHPSYLNHYSTKFEKLEFLGDAVLDYLVTSHIYRCGTLDPGQLTDLRSALVNNDTFASLTVRLGLQKYLLCGSVALSQSIQKYEDYHHLNKPGAHNDFIQIVENGIAEEIVAPKVLGDLFECVAGAIFLDSGYDLVTVWKIFYHIMKNEIADFSKNIPINPVRKLYEKTSLKLDFSSCKSKDDSQFDVQVSVTDSQNQTRCFIGRGDNTKNAKRAAAKLALRYFKAAT